MIASAPAFRDRIFGAVLSVLEADETVRACREGDSIARGCADELSNIDCPPSIGWLHRCSPNLVRARERARGRR